MLKRLYNLLRGSVQVDITGASIERFLNLCALHGVVFWQVKCLDAVHFTAWISPDGYFALRPYARNTGCRIRLLRKRGVPFSIQRMTRRWALWLGLLLCVGIVWTLSGLVWTIEVQGCQTLSEEEVLELFRTEGLTVGARRSDFRLREMRNRVMSAANKLSYFTLNFQGTHAILRIWERQTPEISAEETVPCDVVSQLTGVVEAIRVRTGTALVQPGDTVLAGERLATGYLVNQNDETQVTLLHAQAEADIRTWHTYRAVVPAELYLLLPQEDCIATTSLLAGVRRFPLQVIEKDGGSWYDKQIKRHTLSLREDFRLPLGWSTEKTVVCRVEEAQLDREKLEALLKERMLARLQREKPDAQLIRTDFSLEISEQGAWLGILDVELIETTGQAVPIG